MRCVEACPICGSKDVDLFLQTYPIPVFKCLVCEVKFSRYIKTADEIDQYYSTKFASARHRVGQKLNAEMNYRLILEEALLEPSSRILDIGCGYGFLLNKFKGCADRVSLAGVELSSKERQYAIDLLGEEVPLYRCLKEVPNTSFDLIVCNEVIEHIEDPLGFLDEIFDKLKNGGTLFLLTDNFESKVANTMGCSFPKWIPHSHIIHFCAASLQSLFRLSKFGRCNQPSFFTRFESVVQLTIFQFKSFFFSVSPIDFNDYEETEFKRGLRLAWMRSVLNRFMFHSLKNSTDGTLVYTISRKTRE